MISLQHFLRGKTRITTNQFNQLQFNLRLDIDNKLHVFIQRDYNELTPARVAGQTRILN